MPRRVLLSFADADVPPIRATPFGCSHSALSPCQLRCIASPSASSTVQPAATALCNSRPKVSSTVAVTSARLALRWESQSARTCGDGGLGQEVKSKSGALSFF